MMLMPFAVILAILAVIVLILLFYRSRLAASEDDTLHVNEEELAHVGEQEILAKKLAKVDRIGKILTIIVLLGGLILLSIFLYIHQFADTTAKMG